MHLLVVRNRVVNLNAEHRDSGLGDFGMDGLRNFVETHRCNNICAALDLASTEVLNNTLDHMLDEL